MATLIACLSSGRGTWTEVFKLISSRQWEQIFLITNNFGKEKVQPRDNTEIIVVDLFNTGAPELVRNIKKQLKNKIKGFDVALNLVSGTGKEHMAILEAVLEMGLNFRLVTLKNGKLFSLGLDRKD